MMHWREMVLSENWSHASSVWCKWQPKCCMLSYIKNTIVSQYMYICLSMTFYCNINNTKTFLRAYEISFFRPTQNLKLVKYCNPWLFKTISEKTRTFFLYKCIYLIDINDVVGVCWTIKKHLPNACTTLTSSYYKVRSGRIPLQLENQQTFLAAGVD